MQLRPSSRRVRRAPSSPSGKSCRKGRLARRASPRGATDTARRARKRSGRTAIPSSIAAASGSPAPGRRFARNPASLRRPRDVGDVLERRRLEALGARRRVKDPQQVPGVAAHVGPDRRRPALRLEVDLERLQPRAHSAGQAERAQFPASAPSAPGSRRSRAIAPSSAARRRGVADVCCGCCRRRGSPSSVGARPRPSRPLLEASR